MMRGIILALLLIAATLENASAEAEFSARLAPDANLTIIGMGVSNTTTTLFGVWHEYFLDSPGITKIFVTDPEGNSYVSFGKVSPI
jgi:MFS superfamily sulfate permease-like transporter